MRPASIARVGSFSNLHHVALTVSDLDASARWYSDVLGLVERFREDSPTRRAVVLTFPTGGGDLGLVEHVGRDSQPFDPTVTGLDHAAFSVSSQEEMRERAQRLDEHGVPHSGPIPIPPGEILNFKDPDGIALAYFWDRPPGP
jgi:glyoxylase I family protein